MLRQHLAREFFNLAKGHGLKSARAFEAKRKAADARKQIKHLKHYNHPATKMNMPVAQPRKAGM